MSIPIQGVERGESPQPPVEEIRRMFKETIARDPKSDDESVFPTRWAICRDGHFMQEMQTETRSR